MDHRDYMELALHLAEAGKGQTGPNPIVGAVIVKEGRVVGLGTHLKAGEAHAEVHALRMAGSEARGATVYVTLEPCSHFGKTPPCVDFLIENEVGRVFVATTDPNPNVSGRGIEKLRNAGIEVEVGLKKEEADALNEMFFHYIRTKSPFVTLKSATSLDGKIATVSGESQWITGEQARYDAHRYRAEHDAILVGVNTVLADNPTLTARLSGGAKNPIRIVLDHHLRTPLNANVVQVGDAETWIVTREAAAKKRGSQYNVRVVPFPDKQIEIRSLLQWLGSEGITSLLVEGGATVNDSFLRAGAVQQVITYIAPKLLGGASAPTSFGGRGIERLADARSLTVASVEQLGNDMKIVSRPEEKYVWKRNPNKR